MGVGLLLLLLGEAAFLPCGDVAATYKALFSLFKQKCAA